MEQDGYPSEETLKKIKEWNVSKQSATDLIKLIEDNWWGGDSGFKLSGRKTLILELHTLGWSGNEDIISALKSNFFWNLYWQKSIRGGHYYFKIREVKK